MQLAQTPLLHVAIDDVLSISGGTLHLNFPSHTIHGQAAPLVSRILDAGLITEQVARNLGQRGRIGKFG